MRKKYIAAAAVVIGSLALPGASNASEDKKILLKMPVVYGTNLPVVGPAEKYITKNIPLLTNGSIKVKLYEPKELVAPFEILDAVSTGKVNAGYSAAGYWAGKMPAGSLFSSVPFGPEAGEYMAWLYHGNGLKLWQEMYDTYGYNVKVIPCGIIPPETSGWFTKPINTPEDLKGLNMRFFGLGGKVMQKLGASTTMLPLGEVFPAMEKGALDAAEVSMPAIDRMVGMHKIAKYNYFPGWHQQSTLQEVLIHKPTYDSMSKSQQAAIETTCKAVMAMTFAEGEAIQFKAMRDNVANGVKIMRWSDEMIETFKSGWAQVAVEESANDAFFKKVYDDLTGFRKNYDIWEANAFLPRKTN